MTATECSGLSGSVCNPAFDEDTVRITGASASGLTGVFGLGTSTFRCERPGESALTIRLSNWGDSTGFGQRKVEIEDGTITCEEPGQDGVIRAGKNETVVGDEVTVALEAVDIPEPGLSTWTIDVEYDSAIIRAVDCSSLQGGICNPTFRENKIRVTGAAVRDAPVGTFLLAEIVFQCQAEGRSALTLGKQVFGAAGIGQEYVQPTLEDGSVSCQLDVIEPGLPTPTALPQLPDTGGAEPQSPAAPIAVPLAALGVVLLATAFAFRRYASLE